MLPLSVFARFAWAFLLDSFLFIIAEKADPLGDRLLARACRVGYLQRVFPGVDVFAIQGAMPRLRC